MHDFLFDDNENQKNEETLYIEYMVLLVIQF